MKKIVADLGISTHEICARTYKRAKSAHQETNVHKLTHQLRNSTTHKITENVFVHIGQILSLNVLTNNFVPMLIVRSKYRQN